MELKHTIQQKIADSLQEISKEYNLPIHVILHLANENFKQEQPKLLLDKPLNNIRIPMAISTKKALERHQEVMGRLKRRFDL